MKIVMWTLLSLSGMAFAAENGDIAPGGNPSGFRVPPPLKICDCDPKDPKGNCQPLAAETPASLDWRTGGNSHL